MKKSIVYLIAAIASAFVVGASYMLLYPYCSEKELIGLFYTNMVAILFSIWAMAFNLFDCDFFQSIPDSDRTAAGRGLMWYAGGLYFFATVFIAVISFVVEMHYKYAIFLHAGIIFLLFIAFIISRAVASNANAVERDNAVRRATIDDIKVQLSLLEVAVNSQGLNPAQLNQLSQDLRYVTPSDNIAAKKLEDVLLSNVLTLNQKLNDGPCSQSDLDDGIRACDSVLKLRKKQF